jgi:hypothetical protein
MPRRADHPSGGRGQGAHVLFESLRLIAWCHASRYRLQLCFGSV